MVILLSVVLLSILFFLSRKLTRLLSHIFMRLFRSQSVTIHLLSFLFLPGVVLHELSHLLIANLLLVPTGEVEFFPEIHGSEVKMGSVAIARTDPLRRFLIGIAPLLGGIGLMLVASLYLFTTLFSLQSVLLFYIIFEIANTMFSSSKDMEGAIGFVVGVVAIGIILQLLGVPLSAGAMSIGHSIFLTAILTRLSFFLFLAIGLDIFFVLLFEGLSRLRRH